jgi:hypothetical protein
MAGNQREFSASNSSPRGRHNSDHLQRRMTQEKTMPVRTREEEKSKGISAAIAMWVLVCTGLACVAVLQRFLEPRASASAVTVNLSAKRICSLHSKVSEIPTSFNGQRWDRLPKPPSNLMPDGYNDSTLLCKSGYAPVFRGSLHLIRVVSNAPSSNFMEKHMTLLAAQQTRESTWRDAA